MTVLDAYALTAFLGDEASADEVESLLRARDCHISALNLAESYDRLIRLQRLTRAEVDAGVDLLVRTGRLGILAVDDHLARRTGELRARTYHRTRRPVSLADCVAAATAELLDDVIATADGHLAAMAREIGVEVIALPDSTGKRP